MFSTYFYTFQTNAGKNASKSFCCPSAGDEVLHHWDKQAGTVPCYGKENVHESFPWSTNQFLWSLYDLSGTTNCCTERFGLFLHRLLFPLLWRQKMNGPIGAIMGYLLLPSLLAWLTQIILFSVRGSSNPCQKHSAGCKHLSRWLVHWPMFENTYGKNINLRALLLNASWEWLISARWNTKGTLMAF